ncbi:MAG: cysteine desulfurase [Aerococcus sp.]|nr:cysteine desulfurase [Aerococcus sp.]
MAFQKSASLKGSETEYQVSEQCKKYTLRDNNFVETKIGNFHYEQLVHPTFNDPRTVKLIIKVKKDLSGLDLNVTQANGLRTVDLYHDEKFESFIEPVDFILHHMVQEHVLTRLEEEE